MIMSLQYRVISKVHAIIPLLSSTEVDLKFENYDKIKDEIYTVIETEVKEHLKEVESLKDEIQLLKIKIIQSGGKLE